MAWLVPSLGTDSRFAISPEYRRCQFSFAGVQQGESSMTSQNITRIFGRIKNLGAKDRPRERERTMALGLLSDKKPSRRPSRLSGPETCNGPSLAAARREE